jgi:hypothetical protein
VAKDTDLFELNAAARQTMAQAHQAMETYFDFLKKSVSSLPSGGTELGDKLKEQSVQNIAAVHDLVKRLSQAKDFQDALRIQSEFMREQLNAFAKHVTSLGEAYSKAAAGGAETPFKSSLD